MRLLTRVSDAVGRDPDLVFIGPVDADLIDLGGGDTNCGGRGMKTKQLLKAHKAGREADYHQQAVVCRRRREVI